MSSNEFDIIQFEKRLQSLKDSQESIQSLSAWCLERRQHHKKIVAAWLQVLKKVKVEHRLTLFYLANDVIQYSKRKNFEFVESWGTTLQRATTMVRDEKVKHRILRIFKIWDQRQVYDEEFLADLSGLISAVPKKKVEPQNIQQPDEFQAALLISTMKSCSTLEQATDARLRDLISSNIDTDNVEDLCSLKDRRRVEDAEKEVELAARHVENYVKALEAEIQERKQVLELLDQADQFYETQKGEVKIVVNAYRNFGSRVKNLKKKLEELIPMLISPLPSPDVNAPSPGPDSDIDLPEEETFVNAKNIDASTVYNVCVQECGNVQCGENSNFTNSFSSFMGGKLDFDTRNVFGDNSTITNSISQHPEITKYKSTQASNNNNKTIMENNTDEDPATIFLKSVLPISENKCNIPGLGLDVSDAIDLTPDAQSDVNVFSSSLAHNNFPNIQINTFSSENTIAHSTPFSMKYLNGKSSNFENLTTTLNTKVVKPLLPPPLPPPIFMDDEPCYNKLPPKFPTWSFTNETTTDQDALKQNNDSLTWLSAETSDDPWNASHDIEWTQNIVSKDDIATETPESPPIYEKSGFNEPLEYSDTQNQEALLGNIGDVDHRVITIPMSIESHLPQRIVKGIDIDHRNLISLTGSPANNSCNEVSVENNASNIWTNTDQDYRVPVLRPGDIVESIDMEMSDDECENKQKTNRVLVDLRSQDRDMRSAVQLIASNQQDNSDMDMRMYSNASNTLVDLVKNTKGSNVRLESPSSSFLQYDLNNHWSNILNNEAYHKNSRKHRQNESNFLHNNRELNFFESQHPKNQKLHNQEFLEEKGLLDDPGIRSFNRNNYKLSKVQDKLHNQPVLSTDMVVINDNEKISNLELNENSLKNKKVKNLQEKNKSEEASKIRTQSSQEGSCNMLLRKDNWSTYVTDLKVPCHKINNFINSGNFSKDNRHFVTGTYSKELNNKVNSMKTLDQKSETLPFLNGPLPNASTENQQTMSTIEYDSPNRSKNSTPLNPYSWHGNSIYRGRGYFLRGNLKLPWFDRTARQLVAGSYSHRGVKPRNQYRGFRGRGRGGMW